MCPWEQQEKFCPKGFLGGGENQGSKGWEGDPRVARTEKTVRMTRRKNDASTWESNELQE